MLGKVNDALKFCDEGLKLNKMTVIGYFIRGLSYTYNGSQQNLQLALQDLNICLTINPHYYCAYELRAMIYEKKNQWELAVKDYRESLRRNSKLAYARIRSARILLENLESYTTCLEECKEAILIVNINLFDRIHIYNTHIYFTVWHKKHLEGIICH